MEEKIYSARYSFLTVSSVKWVKLRKGYRVFRVEFLEHNCTYSWREKEVTSFMRSLQVGDIVDFRLDFYDSPQNLGRPRSEGFIYRPKRNLSKKERAEKLATLKALSSPESS
jgi:hypothetical protein